MARIRAPVLDATGPWSHTRRVIEGLSPDDPGVLLLADALRGQPGESVLLVHCGDIPGVSPGATRVVLDVREAPTSAHHCVPHPHGWPPEGFPPGLGPARYVGVWPRAHLGKDFAEASLALGVLCLEPGGSLWCAVRKAKGAGPLGDTLAELCGDVDVDARRRGYRLLRGVRSDRADLAKARSILCARYRVDDPALDGLVLDSAPGVFSRRRLDDGTRALIEHVRALEVPPPGPILDAGAGIGPLALWAARRFPDRPILALESNLVAAGLLEHNADRYQLGPRVRVVRADAFQVLESGADLPPDVTGGGGLALVNPPTHAPKADLARLCRGLARWLDPGGLALLVVNRPGPVSGFLADLGARVDEIRTNGYVVVQARFQPG